MQPKAANFQRKFVTSAENSLPSSGKDPFINPVHFFLQILHSNTQITLSFVSTLPPLRRRGFMDDTSALNNEQNFVSRRRLNCFIARNLSLQMSN